MKKQVSFMAENLNELAGNFFGKCKRFHTIKTKPISIQTMDVALLGIFGLNAQGGSYKK